MRPLLTLASGLLGLAAFAQDTQPSVPSSLPSLAAPSAVPIFSAFAPETLPSQAPPAPQPQPAPQEIPTTPQLPPPPQPVSPPPPPTLTPPPPPPPLPPPPPPPSTPLAPPEDEEIAKCRSALQAVARSNPRDVRYFEDDGSDVEGLIPAGRASYAFLDPIGLKKPARVQNFYGDCVEWRSVALTQNQSATTQIVNATITLTPRNDRRSLPILLNPVGFSIEYGSLRGIIGEGKDAPPNPAIVRLFENLKTRGEGPAVLIGGNTMMLTRLADPGQSVQSNSSTISVTPEVFRNMDVFANATNSKLSLGVPMLLRDPKYAVDFVTRGILSNVSPKNIFSLELGNEPDHWQLPSKCFRYGEFTFSDYLTQYIQTENAILPLLQGTNIVLQGPAIAGCNTKALSKTPLPCWDMYLGEFANKTSSSTKFVSWHRYGNSGCSTKTDLRTLLNDPMDSSPGTEAQSFDWLDRVQRDISPSGKRHIHSEGGSFSCGGNPCMSNTFASALWGLNNYFEVLYRDGIRSMVHTILGHTYSPFNIVDSSGGFIEGDSTQVPAEGEVVEEEPVAQEPTSEGNGGQQEEAVATEETATEGGGEGVEGGTQETDMAEPEVGGEEGEKGVETNGVVGEQTQWETEGVEGENAAEEGGNTAEITPENTENTENTTTGRRRRQDAQGGVQAAPLFYAMWQMVRLVDDIPDAQIFAPTVDLGGVSSSLIKVWGVSGTGPITKIVVIHKDMDQILPLNVRIAVGAGRGGSITRLSADGPFATEVTLAGQSIGSDGAPVGEKVSEILPGNLEGVLSFAVDPISVAVLTIQ
eukprot:comp23542_c2_seq1/m.39707 comp23542_c2_seq1/g.39707  ORF comp23542_c2_seq1/g.39707 comp23542_c2_seq1/m.39707 type:complete len:810 (-) comp23542_c2_seq1:369-2798(-)